MTHGQLELSKKEKKYNLEENYDSITAYLMSLHVLRFIYNVGLGKQSQISFRVRQRPKCVEHNLWPQNPITINLQCLQIYDTVNM